MDVDTKEEDNVLILLNSFPDEENETLVLTLINRSESLNYNDILAALVNYEMRRKDKQSSSRDRSQRS